MINIILQSNKWLQNNGVAVRGYCFDSENNFYEGENLLQFVASVKNENDFRQLLQNINGIFSFVIKNENCLLAASDKSRVIPLFYSFENQIFSISDNPYNLLWQNPKIDSEAEQEFLLSSFLTDEKTLIEGIFQIKPSCFLCFENDKVFQKYYYSYCVKNSELNTSQTLEKDFLAVLENVFRRLIKSANGRQIVVPLSGGYDSRLIAAMLKKLDYQNVVCYTVGRENNCEYLIAKEVAKALGYPYHFIFTGDKKLIENYAADETFQRYYKFSGSFFQPFWMYEYFGVKYLIENNLVEKDAIFVPGHSGDFLAGSQTSKNNIFENDSKKKLIKKIGKYIFTLGKAKQRHIKKISQIIEYQEDYTSFSVFDNFLLKSRLPFVPNNAVRLYEFFGCDVRLPFWDNEILEFFRTLPPSLKRDKLFYNNYLKKNLFDNLKINFENDSQTTYTKSPLQKLKDFVKPFLPNFFLRLASNFQDITCINEISAPLLSDLKKNKINLKTIFPNEIFQKWYLMKLREEMVKNN